METIEIRENRIKVQLQDGSTTVVAKYEDNNGVYFLNENLEKQYADEAVENNACASYNCLF